MAQDLPFYSDSIESFNQIVKKPEQLLEINEELCEKAKEQLKKTYDFCKKQELKTIKSNALPELIIDNFDLEQIWQQIELQNDPFLTRSLINVSKLLVGKDNLIFKNLESKLGENEAVADDKSDENEPNDDAESDELLNELSDNQDESSNDTDSEEQEDQVENVAGPSKPAKKSIVDDEFFKLSEMEQFLESEEKKMNEPDSGNDSEESESGSEDSVDLFEDDLDAENDSVRTAKFKDFFVAKEPVRNEKKAGKRNKFLEAIEEIEQAADKEVKSSFEQRQERLNKRIEEIEENAIGEKPWQLKGEIKAENRPQNSLLEEVVEFDLTSRPAPVITEQTSLQLEDIIKQRIKNKVFDSVERKQRPIETPLEYKKKLLLDQEKSKQSLAQIYEEEFIKQRDALDPTQQETEQEEPELHKEIKTLMTNLFSKLDSLSNFHFTPKPAMPELKIVSNLPAISMEEVAPVATSDATLLAPEEIKRKTKGDIIGKAERSSTDKKRERRQKKLKQQIHVKEKLKREQASTSSNKFSKEKSKEMLEKVTKNKNIDKMDESVGSKSVKSSKAFFAQLEDEVRTQIKSKSFAQKRKKTVNSIDAKKMKM